MAQENKKQNPGNAQGTAGFDAENTKNSQTSTSGLTSANQPAASATAAKKYDAPGSGEISSKSADSQSSPTGVIKDFYDKAKQSAGQVTEKATDKLDEKKSVVTQGLSGVADSIRQVGENLRGAGSNEEDPIGQFTAKYGDALAGQVEQISNYFDKKDVREIFRDVEVFARRNPAVFVGGAFVLGIFAARFLKSSSPKSSYGGGKRSLKSNYSLSEGSRSDKKTVQDATTKNSDSGFSKTSETSSSSGLTSTNPS